MFESWGAGAWLVGFLIAQRLAELAYAQWNTRRLLAAGGVEFGRAHYPLMVSLHALWLLTVWIGGHRRDVDPIWFAVFVLLQAGRLWVIASLGPFWTTRVIVRPGISPRNVGPYRWLKHPNYAIVCLEIAVVPLALGLPAVAAVFSLANAAMLCLRIPVENRALAWAASEPSTRLQSQPPSLANAGPRR
jgi:methyltransferase